MISKITITLKKAILSLKWAAKEMERRYDILQAEKVRDTNSMYSNHRNHHLVDERDEEETNSEVVVRSTTVSSDDNAKIRPHNHYRCHRQLPPSQNASSTSNERITRF